MNTTRRRFILVVAVGLFTLLRWNSSADAYQLAQRWTNTASGVPGALGSAITLTWSIVPDGTFIGSPLDSSSLISFMDATFGGGTGDLQDRPWFDHIAGTLDRWSQLSGVTYVYEPNDDGVRLGNFPGFLGVRGDIRIGATLIDGLGDVLGFNYQPNNGDMVLDTGEATRFAMPQDDYLGLRSVIAHEHGHGLGLRHVKSSDSAFLMESLVGTAFDGPQLDEIRGVHRAYGDALEKSNAGQGNNTAANATSLGSLSPGTFLSIGDDAAPDTRVEPSDIDFVSIDDSLDFDFFSFDVPANTAIDLFVTPLGPTYLEGPGGGSESPLAASLISDLTLTLFDTDGMTPLSISNTGELGESEAMTGFEFTAPGTYFARVSGSADDVQLYQLAVSAVLVPEPVGCLAWQLWLLSILVHRHKRSA